MTQEKIVNLTGNDITIVGNYRQVVAMIPRCKNPATQAVPEFTISVMSR